jgi:hypothetical protein
MIRRNQFVHGSVVFRVECFNHAGLFYEQYKYAQDYDLFMRISERFDVENLPDPLYFYRLNSQAISSVNLPAQTREAMIIVEAAKMRRRGLMKEWSDEAYSRCAQRVDSFPGRMWLRNKVELARGRNYFVMGLKSQARTSFIKAFCTAPTIQTAYHLIKTMV